MSEDWRSFIGDRDREIYAAAGYGGRLPRGRRPALLVIDTTYGFVGRERLPILESIREYPNSCGEDGWRAVDAIVELLGLVRELGWPVVYSAGFAELGIRGVGRWADKHPRSVTSSPPDSNEIVAEIAPGPDEPVLPKTKPSLFHGTPLVDLLLADGIDTLVVTGGTTSGCVRATVVDAFSHNLAVLVAEDAVFDRGELSHAVNLFDMDQKYADVLPASAIADWLRDVGPARRVTE
ncbi:MAG TPA: isochorismatase family protein [Candidatus Limnocylindrales bacterium]